MLEGVNEVNSICNAGVADTLILPSLFLISKGMTIAGARRRGVGSKIQEGRIGKKRGGWTLQVKGELCKCDNN